MKAIWSGSLSFGLLSIPVQLYSAIAEHRFGFKILCGKCNTPLKNIRWCEECKKAVSWDDTVKGYKTDKSFLVLDKEALKALKPEKTNTIDIKEFVEQSKIEMLYIESHYYLLPKQTKDKAFHLFTQALKQSKKVAIAQFIMHEKEHLVAISFYKNILLLNTLHYFYEIREITEQKKEVQVTQEEIKLALLLINKSTRKTFALDKYKDTFVEHLKKALQSAQKAKTSKKQTKKEVQPKRVRKPKSTSLVQSLKASLRDDARA